MNGLIRFFVDRDVLEEVFTCLSKTGRVIEEIVNDCLGLPPNFLGHEYNPDRSWDFMTVMHYFPATESENNGITEHEDGNCFTFVFQDESGGLQVRKDGQWVPVTAPPDTIIVNISDVIQVHILIQHVYKLQFKCFLHISNYIRNVLSNSIN